MRKTSRLEGRDEIHVCVTVQEALAIERCLKAEDGVSAGTHQRVRVIHFDRRVPRHLTPSGQNEHVLDVRVTERSSKPDQIRVEIRRVLSDETRSVVMNLPRRALRPAFRKHALDVLAPGLPGDLAPKLAIECTRRTWRSGAGWVVELDRDIAFHRVQPNVLERTGRIALGVPDRFADGRVLLTLRTGGATLPRWLEQVVSSAPEWNVLEEGLALLAPRPQPSRGPLPGLRLVVH